MYNFKKFTLFFLLLIFISSLKTAESFIELKGTFPTSSLSIAIMITSLEQIELLKQKNFKADIKDSRTQLMLKTARPEIIEKLFEYGYLNPRYFRDKDISTIIDESLQSKLFTAKKVWRKKMEQNVTHIITKQPLKVQRTGSPCGKLSQKKPSRYVPGCAICGGYFSLERLIKTKKLSQKEHEKKCLFLCAHGYNDFHDECIKDWVHRKKSYLDLNECPICRANLKK